MSSTVQVEKGRWRYLDAYLTNAGSGVSGIASSVPTVTFKKYGDLVFSSKVVDIAGSVPTTTLALAATAGDTTITVADSSIFPPENGYINLDTGGANEELNVLFTENNTTTNTLTLRVALANNHIIGEESRLQLWREITGGPAGYYSILFKPTELDTLDIFVYGVTGAGFDDFSRTIDIVPREHVDSETAPSLSTCLIKGHILNLNGTPMQNASVGARLLALPETLSGVGIQDQVVSATTDSNGFFQITLVQDATVDIFIPAIGYRRTIVVPSTTLADLFEISSP